MNHLFEATIETNQAEYNQILHMLFQNLAFVLDPSEIYIFQIDGWFSQKWLGFTGKMNGAFGVRHGSTSPTMTIPPFVPNRVLSSNYYQKEGVTYVPKEAPLALHQTQAGSENFSRRLIHISPTGLFCYYSKLAEPQEPISVMVYYTKKQIASGFYISWKKKGATFQLTKLVNISRAELLHFLQEAKWK